MRRPQVVIIPVQATGYVTPCWLWGASVNRWTGYGQTHRRRISVSAHRVICEASHGPIPDGLTVDHLCRQRTCVNPDHMEIVSQRENNLRGLAARAGRRRLVRLPDTAGLSHCLRGHPLSGENLYLSPKGKRGCRACRAIAERAAWGRERTRRDAGTPGWAQHYQTRKQQCPQGHPLSGENLYRQGGSRHCRECMRQRNRAYYHRRRDAQRA